MLKFSYHNHTIYSDGKNTPEEMLEKAYNAGYSHFAITDHICVPGSEEWTLDIDKQEEYIERLASLKKRYKGKMKVYIGIESDWFKNVGTSITPYQEIKDSLDITVGSIHAFLKNNKMYLLDENREKFEECLKEMFASNATEMVKEYFECIEEMLEDIKPDIIGHIDMIRIYNTANRYFDTDTDEICCAMEKLARALKRNNTVTELNMGGDYRMNNGIYYPSDTFLSILKKEGVAITVGLDAHSVEMVDSYYNKTIETIASAGYNEIAYFDDGVWKKADTAELLR